MKGEARAPLTLAVAGAGAVGTVLAHRLASAGHDVTVVARGRRAEQLAEGVKVSGRPTRPVKVTAATDLVPHDVLFLAVKEDALAALLAELAPAIRPDTMVVPLVNGIPFWLDGDGGCIGRIVGAVVYITSWLDAEGAAHPGPRERLLIGNPGKERIARLPEMATLLREAGIETQLVDDIRSHVWSKLALNLATNPLSVVAEADLRTQSTDPELVATVRAVLNEAIQLGNAVGIEPSMNIDEMIATTFRAGAVRPSMLQDFRAGRPLELEAIAWRCLRLAERAGVSMPVTRTVAGLARYRASLAAPQRVTS